MISLLPPELLMGLLTGVTPRNQRAEWRGGTVGLEAQTDDPWHAWLRLKGFRESLLTFVGRKSSSLC